MSTGKIGELREYRDADLEEALEEIEAESSEPVKAENLQKALPDRTMLVITKAHDELRALTLEQVLYALYPDDEDVICLRCKYIISKIFKEAEEETAKSQKPETASPKKFPMLPSRREKYQKEREEMKKKREAAKLAVLEYMNTCKPLEDYNVQIKNKTKKEEKKVNHHDPIKPGDVPCYEMCDPFSPRPLMKCWAKVVIEPIKKEELRQSEEQITEKDDTNVPIVDDFIEEKEEDKNNSSSFSQAFTRSFQRSAVMKVLRKKKGKKVLVNTVTQSEC